MGVKIDMWYGDNFSETTRYDWNFYADGEENHPMFAPYRGNLFINGKMVGDFCANTLQDFVQYWYDKHTSTAHTVGMCVTVKSREQERA